MKIKTALKYYYMPVRVAKIEKKKSYWKLQTLIGIKKKKKSFIHLLMAMQNGLAILEHSLESFL